MYIFAQIVGGLGILLNVIIYQQKARIRILVCKLSSDVVWMAHYLLLGAYSAAAIAVIGIARESVFIKVKRGTRAATVSLCVFIAASILSAVLTWAGPLSLLPAAASVLSVYSFSRAEPRLSRLLSFPISGAMGTYSFFHASWAGVVNETLTVLSSLAGVVRFDIKRRKADSENALSEREKIAATQEEKQNAEGEKDES